MKHSDRAFDNKIVQVHLGHNGTTLSITMEIFGVLLKSIANRQF